jgi:hypothetical protein
VNGCGQSRTGQEFSGQRVVPNRSVRYPLRAP